MPVDGKPQTEAVTTDTDKTSSLLSEGVMIFLITALAYVACLVFEVGYANRLGIPFEFISLGIGNILYFAIALIASSVFMHQVGSFLVTVSQSGTTSDSGEHTDTIPYLIVTKHGFNILIIIILVCSIDINWSNGIILFTTFVFPIILDFVPFTLDFHKDSYLEHLKWKLKRPARSVEETSGGLLANKQFKVAFNAFSFSLFLFGVCYFTGLGWAKNRTTYPVVGDDKSPEVVLRRYNDRYLLAKFDPESNRLTGDFRFVNESDFKDIFRTVTIGLLQPPLPKAIEVKKKVEPKSQDSSYQAPEEM